MMTKKEAFKLVYVLHKFYLYLLGNKFIFYVDHMALLYLVLKPQVSRRIIRWLFLFLEYNFSVIYKLGRSHFMANTTRNHVAYNQSLCNWLSFTTISFMFATINLVLYNFLAI